MAKCDFQGLAGVFRWQNDSPYSENHLAINLFITDYLPDGALVKYLDDTYTEICYNGRDYGVSVETASDFNIHTIKWKLLGPKKSETFEMDENQY